MIIDYKKMEKDILDEISTRKEELNMLYKTVEEANEFGYKVVFGSEDIENSIKSAFEAGRAIGVREGAIDELNNLLILFYNKENNS